MARAGLCVAILLAGCGLASKDFEISQDFQAGGGPPDFSHSFDSTALTGPLSADVSKIHSITLTAARIEATDNNGDISFVSDAKISISSSLQANALLALLPSPPSAGATSVQLHMTGTELKPYIQGGGTLGASIAFSPTPATARGLRLVLTIHGSLL